MWLSLKTFFAICEEVSTFVLHLALSAVLAVLKSDSWLQQRYNYPLNFEMPRLFLLLQLRLFTVWEEVCPLLSLKWYCQQSSLKQRGPGRYELKKIPAKIVNVTHCLFAQCHMVEMGFFHQTQNTARCSCKVYLNYIKMGFESPLNTGAHTSRESCRVTVLNRGIL